MFICPIAALTGDYLYIMGDKYKFERLNLAQFEAIIQCFGKILHLLITIVLSAMADVFNTFLQLVNFDDYVFILGNENDNTLHKHCNINNG